MQNATTHFSEPHKGDKPRQYPEGRKCLQCGQPLSRWNPSDICFAHQSDRDLILTRMGR